MNITLSIWMTNSFKHNLNASWCLPPAARLLITSPCFFFSCCLPCCQLAAACFQLSASYCLIYFVCLLLPVSCYLFLVACLVLSSAPASWCLLNWPPFAAHLPPTVCLLLPSTAASWCLLPAAASCRLQGERYNSNSKCYLKFLYIICFFFFSAVG